ncbi:type II toxin-antitoxin system RelE/ParE family toxin [Crenothrix sp.]|uniref:type II toxin-antitoxin system RelE/ParE family toxin n=1 Tax=Crenothrix sp. TaxID=3100433 RepID=UPI00374DC47B
MNECCQVHWSKIAENDLIAIIQFINNTSSQSAAEAFIQIKTKTADLLLFPERGRIVPELLAHGIGHYRELIIVPWRVIYRFSGDSVYVLAVIDSRRNVEDVLLDRLIRTNNESPLS